MTQLTDKCVRLLQFSLMYLFWATSYCTIALSLLFAYNTQYINITMRRLASLKSQIQMYLHYCLNNVCRCFCHFMNPGLQKCLDKHQQYFVTNSQPPVKNKLYVLQYSIIYKSNTLRSNSERCFIPST